MMIMGVGAIMDDEEPLAFDDPQSDSDATVGGRFSCVFDPAGAMVTTRDCRGGTRMGLRGGGPLSQQGGRATPPSSL